MKNKLRLLTLGLISSSAVNLHAAVVDLRVLETTDLHGFFIDYDYYTNSSTEKYGLIRTANLIKQAHGEVKNSVLVDNGDLIQGNPLSDYINKIGIKDRKHPAYILMNDMKYDVGNLGNHEFNYGLDYLKEVIAGANFPIINSNVYDEKTKENYFKPYYIQDKKVVDRDGKEHTIKVGYIGFVPPGIMVWDKENLEGKVFAESIIDSAKKFIPEMKAKGADVIIAIPHSSIASNESHSSKENAVYDLSKVPGINGILFGHAHAIFPSKSFAGIEGIDITKGTINGVASVMPGQWGDNLGLLDLVLDNSSGKWEVVDGKGFTRPIFDKKALVDRDENLAKLIDLEHQGTIKYVQTEIGKVKYDMFSYLALNQSDPTVQIVNDMQLDHLKTLVQGDADYENYNLLSAAAPFRAGGRYNAPDQYVEVSKGPLTIANAADLYVYPNTFTVVKASGKEVRQWLECSALMFNQIDPTSTAPQELYNWKGFRTYNFDVIAGLTYQIDVTQPAQVDNKCKVSNPDAHRIVDLEFQGKPVTDDMKFLVATNNYRGLSGHFPGTGPDHIAIAAPDTSREVLQSYINKMTKKHGEIDNKYVENWRFKKIDSKVDLDILFQTSPKPKAREWIESNSIYPVTYQKIDDVGFAVYKIKLN